jgi:hypothetical protein
MTTTTCGECGTTIHRGLGSAEQPAWLDSDGIECSETPVFHDHEPEVAR